MFKLDKSIIREIDRQVKKVIPGVIEIRRELHRHPERSKREKKTSELISAYLSRLGYQVHIGKNVYSVTTVINGQQGGKTIALRADIDALKLQEQTGLPFASEVEGVMHACGHDAHTAILLGVAEVLSGMSYRIPGNVKLFFQPSEEAFPGGALPMIEEGAMESPKVSAVFALHIDPTIPTGCISLRSGASIGGVTGVNIKVKGRGGHFAKPHEAVDPIVVAAHVIVSLQSMVTRQVDYWKPFVLTFGQIVGGTRDNIIPSDVIIRGDMAAIDSELREAVEQNIERLVNGIAKSFGACCEVEFWRGYPTMENDTDMTALVKEVATDIIGQNKVLIQEPRLVGEDFAYFAQMVPAVMWFLGAWDKSKHTVPTSYHDPGFDIDESCIPLGIELTIKSALEYLFRNTEGG